MLKRYRESAVPVAVGTPLLEFGDPQDLDIEVEALSRMPCAWRPAWPARCCAGAAMPLAARRVTRIEPGGFTKTSALGVEGNTRVRTEIASPPEQWRRLSDAYRVEVEFVLRRRRRHCRCRQRIVPRGRPLARLPRVVDGRARRTAVGVGGRAALAAEILDGLAAARGDRPSRRPGGRGVRVRAVR